MTLYYLGWDDNDDDYYVGNTVTDLGFYSSVEQREEAKKRYEYKHFKNEFPFTGSRYHGTWVESEVVVDKDQY